MRVVFGWYTFKIKSYNPRDFGVEYNEKDDATFEVRQRCFHLFWIPFFGTGKVYALRSKGKLYDLPQEYIALITKQHKHRTPFYTFSLPILVIAGLLFYLINKKFKENEGHQHLQAQYVNHLNHIDKELSRLTTNHYIKIIDFSNYSNSNHRYLKVEAINSDSLKLFLIEPTSGSDKSLRYFSYVKDVYLKNREKLDTITLAKNELDKAVCKDYNAFYDKTAIGHNLLYDGNNYVIEEVQYMKGPLLRFEHSYQQHEITLINIGDLVELVDIKNMEGDIVCENPLPLHIPKTSTFTLNMNNFYLADFKPNPAASYKCMLVLEDTLSNKYNYILHSKDLNSELERIAE